MVYFYLNKCIRRSENKKSADIKEGDYYVEYKAQNRDTFIDEVFETNVDMIFECIYNYMVIQDEK